MLLVTLAIEYTGLTFVFTTGVLALLSPCGYPMLPGYIAYYLGLETTGKTASLAGVACTLGLLSVFSMIGILTSIIGGFMSPYMSSVGLIAGILVIFMGISILVGLRLPMFRIQIKAPKRRGLLGIYLYGVAYGLANLGCTAPIFFSILFYAVTIRGVFGGVITFLVYSIGMSLPLILTTILIAKTKDLLIKRILNLMPRIQKVSGIILIILGCYLIYFYI